MIIQKINGTYLADHDRILLRMSSSENEELRLWITRRTCLDLLAKVASTSVKSIEKTNNVSLNSAKLIDQFNQETLSEKLDYQVPFEPKNKLPLGHEPILIKAIGWRTLPDLPDGSLNIAWDLMNGKVVNTPLNGLRLNALRLLIEKLVLEANWGTLSQPQEKVVSPPQNVVH